MADSRDENGAPTERSLDELSKRLGSLEQSLTVVAAEIGVTGFPTFRHLDPQTVYDEAIRLARVQILGLEARLQAAVETLAQSQEAANRQRDADNRLVGGRLAAVEGNLQSLTLRLKEVAEKLLRRDERGLSDRLAKLDHGLTTLDARIDTLWSQIDSLSRSDAQARGQQSATHAALADEAGKNRHRAVDTRLAAQEQSLAQLRGQLAGISAYLQGPSEDRQLAAPAAPVVDLDVLRDEILAKMRQWLADRQGGDALPLMAVSESPNPLVMGAAERAIVRLTHRIERMEAWRDALTGEAEQRGRGRSLKSRLFES